MMDVWGDTERHLSLAAAEEWRGTQHRNRIAVIGTGIDCIRFVVEILRAADLVDGQQLPSYPIAWGIGESRNRIADALEAVLDVQRIAPGEWVPQWGDVTIWKVGRQSNHCGIVIGGQVWHVACGKPVGPSEISQVRPEIQEVIRLQRPGWTVPPGSVNLRQL